MMFSENIPVTQQPRAAVSRLCTDLSAGMTESGVRFCQFCRQHRQTIVVVEQNQRRHRLEKRSSERQTEPAVLNTIQYTGLE